MRLSALVKQKGGCPELMMLGKGKNVRKIIAGCATDKGMVRMKNQDRVICHTAKTEQGMLTVACVCDGIGSFTYGEIAAEMVTEGMTLWFQSVRDKRLQALSENDLVEDFEATVRELNQLICERRRQAQMNLGCTMSALIMVDRNYYIFHVGDSRIYLIGESVCQVTRDEVAMTESDGLIRTKLANYMGKEEPLWLNRIHGVLGEGEAFILGSDGLFRKWEEKEVQEKVSRISNEEQVQKLCVELIRIVEEKGERDNISCAIVKVKKR